MPEENQEAGDRQAEGHTGLSRRSMLAGLGALGAAGAGAAGGFFGGRATVDDEPVRTTAAQQIVPFRGGSHQAGIVTPQQDRLTFAAFDVTATTAAELREMLRDWTKAAEAMCHGQLVPGNQGDPMSPPADTGEAQGLLPGNLTITIGYSPRLFDDRFGLAHRKPKALAELPELPGEQLDPRFTGGDIMLQACADDPVVSFHAIRDLARIASGTAVVRYLTAGFGRTASTSAAQQTPRNLFGFKDGTRNIKTEQQDLLRDWVWIGDRDTEAPWMRGGTYFIGRRIKMFLHQWDRDYLQDQENTFGRFKTTGAPLTGTGEFDRPDFHARKPGGDHVIPTDAHIRLAAHENNDGLRILRRGYSFTDGLDETGNIVGGLYFILFCADPQQFVTLQRKLGSRDALREYILHTGSGLFACPPGLARGQDWADQLYHS